MTTRIQLARRPGPTQASSTVSGNLSPRLSELVVSCFVSDQLLQAVRCIHSPTKLLCAAANLTDLNATEEPPRRAEAGQMKRISSRYQAGELYISGIKQACAGIYIISMLISVKLLDELTALA